MNITSVNQISKNFFNKTNSIQRNKNSVSLSGVSDVFQRSTVSFKGDNLYNNDDFKDYIFDIAKERTIAMVAELEENGVECDFEDIFDIVFSKALTDQILYFCVAATSELRSNISKTNFELGKYLEAAFGGYTDLILEKLEEIGIEDKRQYLKMLQTFDLTNNAKLAKVFEDSPAECLKIYYLLQQKNNIAKYPDLMYEIYLSETFEQKPNYSKMDEVGNYLTSIGCFTTNEFVEKHPELKVDFNDLSYSKDIVDAIEYHRSVLPCKKVMLEEILAEHPNIKYNADHIYRELSSYVDYLFEQNNGKSLGDLSVFMETALSSHEFKQKNIDLVAPKYNGFSSIQDKIDFYTLMATTNTSPKEFDRYCIPSFIEEIGPIEVVQNKNEVVNKISFIKNISYTKALEFYKNNSVILALANGNDKKSFEFLKTIINCIDTGVLKKSDSLLGLYNSYNKTKLKTLNKADVFEFVDLLKYAKGINILAQSKNEKVLPVEILKRNKAEFQSVEKEIKTFLQNTEIDFYVGMSAFDVFQKYSDLILSSKGKIPQLLSGLARVDGDVNEYSARKEKLESLQKFFSSTSELRDFLINNQIKLSGDESEKKYFEASMDVLNLLYDENSHEDSLKKIKQLSGFQMLLNSKAVIGSFIEKYSQLTDIKELLRTAVDKSVSNLSELDDIFETYKDDNNDFGNILAQIKQIPENFNFMNYKFCLNYFSHQLMNYSYGLKVDNSNILNLDVVELLKHEKFSKKVNQLICMLMGNPEAKNYIGFLDNAKTQSPKQFGSFAISNEIATLAGKTDESYRNIVRELKLDNASLKLMPKSSFSEYITAISSNLPQEFIDFVNSDEWTTMDNGEKINLNCHARLRIIDRFALREAGSIDNLYSKQTIEKLKNLLDLIYKQTPYEVEVLSNNRLAVYSKFEDKPIVSIFSKSGALISVYPRGI